MTLIEGKHMENIKVNWFHRFLWRRLLDAVVFTLCVYHLKQWSAAETYGDTKTFSYSHVHRAKQISMSVNTEKLVLKEPDADLKPQCWILHRLSQMSGRFMWFVLWKATAKIPLWIHKVICFKVLSRNRVLSNICALSRATAFTWWRNFVWDT